MKCVVCGTELAEGALLCPQCGSVVRQEDVLQERMAHQQLTKKEFCDLPGMKTYKNNIRGCAVVLYACAAVTALLAVFEWGEQSALADAFTRQMMWGAPSFLGSVVAAVFGFLIRFDRIIAALLLVGLGIWLQLGKSRVSAILTLVYGSYSMIVGSISLGRLQGWWVPVIGGFAVYYTIKFNKLWKQYRKNGVLPDEVLSGK